MVSHWALFPSTIFMMIFRCKPEEIGAKRTEVGGKFGYGNEELPHPYAILTLNSSRKVPARNCQSRRIVITSPSSTIYIPPSHSFFRCLRAECIHTSTERVADYRLWVFAALDKPAILQRQRRGAMPCHINSPEPCSEL